MSSQGEGAAGQTIAEALRRATTQLAAAAIDNPALDARLLLAHATGQDQATLLRNRQTPIDPTRYHHLVARRAAREPIALILGHQGFWSLDLAVSPATLIPRPDTETLIEAAITARPDRASVRHILDLGTGTGCLLLAALTEYPAAWGLGLDRNPQAAALAQENARALHLAPRASIAVANWAAPLTTRFDLILSNPPYIPTQEIPGLMPEVAHHEPRSALDGGPDGLDAYRELLAALPTLLTRSGLAILELGAGQASAVATLATVAGFKAYFRKDIGGVDRALVLENRVSVTREDVRPTR